MDAAIRSRSAILTVAFHLLIFLVLLFTAMNIQIPPFAEAGGGGVLVNIGTLDEASGDVQPMSEVVTKEPAPEKIKTPPAEEKNIATQDFEESPIVKEEKKETKKPVITKTETKPVKVEPVKKVNEGALYKGGNTASKSQGTGEGKGDQGDPNGSPLSKYTGKNGSGTGTGTSTGPGDYDGPPGKGKNGIFADLGGRQMTRTPKISDNSQETGKVVVAITVDKDGNVTGAIPGARGSQTTSSYLFQLAKDAALKAKFSPSPDADIQRGTITFIFVVQ